jgi:hypothetical protein
MERHDRRVQKGGFKMPDLGYMTEPNPVENDSSAAAIYYPPRRQEGLNIPASHEERLEWVRKSCERFFEKVREFDALRGLPELN